MRHFNKRIFLIALGVIACVSPQSGRAEEELAREFQRPPVSARPWVFYFIGDGNSPVVTREGLTRDLEAMKAQGLGGVVLFYGWMFRDPDGKGHWQDEPAWWDTMRFAIQEARRVGLQVLMFNSPVWNSGGPWVKPTDAMKEFTWSRAEIQGGRRISMTLPPLPQREGFAWDAFVVAYPTPGAGRTTRMRAAKPAVVSSPHEAGEKPQHARHPTDMVEAGAPLQALVDGNYLTSITLKPDGEQFVEYAFGEEFACDAIYVQLDRQRGAVRIEVQTGDTTGKLTAHCQFAMDAPGSADGKAPVEPRRESFPPVKAKRFRIVFKPDNKQPVHVAEAELLNHDEVASAESFIPFFRAQSATRPPFPPEAFAKDVVAKPPANRTVPGDKVMDLTARVKDGKLDWDAPAGKWTILRFGYTLTGIRTVRGWAVPHLGEGFEVDRFDRAAVERHFNAHIAKFLDDPELKGAIQGIEEDSWEAHWQNWSAAFPAEFRARRGYDLARWLPALTGEVVDTPDATRLFLHDFRRTISDLIADNFYGAYRELAHSRGVQFHAEAAGPRVEQFPPTDPLQFKGRTDVPMGEFHSFFTDKIIQPDIKEAASAAHLYGQNIAAAEAFTGLDDFLKAPFDIKALGDRAFCRGINHFYLHVYNHKPDERKPGPIMSTLWGVGFNRHQTWWAMAHGLFDYFARCQYLLRQGNFVGDLLYYYGENAPAFAWPERLPSPPVGYDYDWCNTEVLLTRLTVKDGGIVAPNGTSYRVLVLPDEPVTSEPVRRKLADLAQAGAWIIGPKLDRPLAGLLAAKNIPPDFTFADGLKKPDLLFIHRVTGDADIYFLSNQGDATGQVDCEFRVAGKQPELWDAVTGTMRELPEFRIGNGRTVMPMQFAPREAFFVVFRNGVSTPDPAVKKTNFPPQETVQELSGPWEVSFDPKWGGPEKITFDTLADWTQRPEPGIRSYSGTAVYRMTFDWAGTKPNPRIFLNLGRVNHLADVRVNGCDLGVVWCAPWQLDVTDALKPGKNDLEIQVANVWINRLLGDQDLPEEERFTSTNASKQCLGGRKPVASGLIGPVTLQSAVTGEAK